MIPHGLTPEILDSLPQGKLLPTDTTQATIDAVVSNIRRLCGWHVFPVATEDVVIPYRGDDYILAPTMRLVEVISAECSGSEISAENMDAYPHGEISLHHRPAGAPWRIPKQLHLTMKHGYELEDVASLLGVIIQMIARAGDTTASGDANLSVGNVSYTLASGITPKSSEWLVIDAYRLRQI